MYDDQDCMEFDEAFDRAETLWWKRELEDEPDRTYADNGDGTAGWPR
jgi:hypothetical protein